MPVVVPLAVFLGSKILGIIQKGTTIAELIGILLAIYKIYSWLVAAWVAFWFICAVFAKELLTWWVSLLMKMVAYAMDAVGAPDAMQQMVQLINSLPPVILDGLAWWHVFDNISMMLSALFLNMSLRSVPFIGGLFRG